MRLDRLLCNQPDLNRRQVQQLLACGKVSVDKVPVRDGKLSVDRFNQVDIGDRLIQAAEPAHYLMLHKPAGVVSATTDAEHKTVIDLIDQPWAKDLHIAGRLDKASTGLLLLTNDGRWSKQLSRPEHKLPKRYRIRTDLPIHPNCAEQFARGLYFAFEDITTAPATLELINSKEAYITLFEGRYHQIKRMFGYYRNQVLAIHREAIGTLLLDPTLKPDQYRPLTEYERALLS